ncbi:hypothetical protein ACN47E_008010 [Coniothyrium glycines]
MAPIPLLQSGLKRNSTASWSKRDMSTGTKVGLAIIPTLLCLGTMLLVSFMWWRKRQMRRKLLDSRPPPVPEKDYQPRGRTTNMTSVHDGRSSRVFNMAAFTTPIHHQHKREASIIGQSPERKSAFQRDECPRDTKTVRLAVPEILQAENDSPVDGRSPFRLKRGDTTKRLTLGSEISKVWPSPPPAAWIRPTIRPGQASSGPHGYDKACKIQGRQPTDTEVEIIGLYTRS